MRLEQPLGQGPRLPPQAPLALQAWKPEGQGEPGIAPKGEALGGLVAKKEAPAGIEIAKDEGAHGNRRTVLFRIAQGGKPAKLRVGIGC